MSAPLLKVLGTMLPSPEQTAMLKASLYQGEKAVQAWQDWNRYGGLKRVLEKPTTHAVKRLLPLLSANQRKNRIPLALDLQRTLRTAQLREQSRNPVFRRACKLAFETLTNAKIPFLVLKGAAFAETVYDEPSLRHCHDCDLFVSRSHLNDARESLLNAGFIEPAELRTKEVSRSPGSFERASNQAALPSIAFPRVHT
jgi:hypothetical protein